MKWITSTTHKNNQYVELENDTTITVFENRYKNGYAFAVRVEQYKDEPSYSREYRTKTEAKQAAMMAMRDDLEHWQGDFPQWQLSKHGNYFCVIEGEVCFTIFRANGSYKICGDQIVLRGTYANETDAMSAVSKILEAAASCESIGSSTCVVPITTVAKESVCSTRGSL
jgi:hypothetical protein